MLHTIPNFVPAAAQIRTIIISVIDSVHINKKCGSLYLLLVPLAWASRIARLSRKSNAEAHTCMYQHTYQYLLV